jgi:hypothetical protein
MPRIHARGPSTAILLAAALAAAVGPLSPRAAAQDAAPELAAVTKKLEDIGTRKAETIRRMNELAVEARQLQAQGKGST